MADAIAFPAWFGPKDSDPVQVRSPVEIQPGWVQHFGHYNVQRGCWVPLHFQEGDAVEINGLQGVVSLDAGEDGGALPADLKGLRAAYHAKFGKKAFNGWDADKLREKLA